MCARAGVHSSKIQRGSSSRETRKPPEEQAHAQQAPKPETRCMVGEVAREVAGRARFGGPVGGAPPPEKAGCVRPQLGVRLEANEKCRAARRAAHTLNCSWARVRALARKRIARERARHVARLVYEQRVDALDAGKERRPVA